MDNNENRRTDIQTSIECADQIDSWREDQRDVVARVEMSFLQEQGANLLRSSMQLQAIQTNDLGSLRQEVMN